MDCRVKPGNDVNECRRNLLWLEANGTILVWWDFSTEEACDAWSSSRRKLVSSEVVHSRHSACSGDVCRRRSRASHHRARFEAATRRGRLSDKCRPVCMRVGDVGAKYRLSWRRHSAAGDDGRYFRLGGADAVHGGVARCRIAWNLRLGYFGWRICAPGCSVYEQTLASIPASRPEPSSWSSASL